MNEVSLQSFDGIEQVVSDGNKFKIRLGIGEDAYQTLKLAKGLQTIWDVKGAAGAGAAAAASPMVATTFFGGGGLLSTLGIGAAAATPVGWVIAAAVASGGAYYGVMSLAGRYTSSRVETIPKFINSPIDLLGATLFDMIGGLGLKVAILSNDIEDAEREALVDYFVEVWGLDEEYIRKSIPIIEEQVRERNLKDMVKALAEFQIDNPDCNPAAMKKDILELLSEIALADGEIDEREELALELVERELNSHLSLTSTTIRSVTKTVTQMGLQTGKIANALTEETTKGFTTAAQQGSKLAANVASKFTSRFGRPGKKE